MLSRYDAVVIGAGPAGSMAAYEIAAAGFSVVLLEKHKRPGFPVCCAEAVPRLSLEKMIIPRKEWISASIDRVRVSASSGEQADIFRENTGYILDRRVFDYDLAQRAIKAGCSLKCETIGLELTRCGELFESLKIMLPDGHVLDVDARIFIAADGVESKIARRAGINNLIDTDDIEALLQYRLRNISVEPDTIEFYVGNNVAPGSYIWVFPKSRGSANVGIGVSLKGHRGSQTSDYLERFIRRRFEGAAIETKTCGLVPRYQGEKMFRMRNLMVVGDAARAVDSLSGAGIIYAMLSGKYAGLAAVEYISGRIGNINDIEELYPRRFLKEKGEELALYARLRQVYNRLDDKDFADIILALEDYFKNGQVDGFNAGRLLAGIVRTRPRLLRLVRYLI
jgi:digeranylgeranylglycerophospholipid reductase